MKTKDKTVLYILIPFMISCTKVVLPYKKNAEIKREFNETYFYNPKSLIGFRKDWNWKYYSRANAKAEMKIDKGNIESFLKFATPIYAATRQSFDNTAENLLIFHIDNNSYIENLLRNHFIFIDSLIYNIASSYKNFDDREVKMYYSHDREKKNVSAPVMVEEFKTNQKYLIYYTASYNNLFSYLKQIYEWYVIRWEGRDKYMADHLSSTAAFIPDSIVMLWPFSSVSFFVGTIGQFDDIK